MSVVCRRCVDPRVGGRVGRRVGGIGFLTFTQDCLLTRAYYKEIDMGMLHYVRETLCIGLDEEKKVNGKYRDLQELLILMAKFYLTVNKQRKDKLDWFGEREGTFKVAIGGDGACTLWKG